MSHLISCPECKKQLQVPGDLLGKMVQCPECKYTFTAAAPDADNSDAETTAAEAVASKVPEWDKRSKTSDGGKRMTRHESEDDDRDKDDDDDSSRKSRRGRFRCPYCGSNEIPVQKSKVSTAGWVVMIILLLFCFPLFWIGFFITEDYKECYECGIKVGG